MTKVACGGAYGGRWRFAGWGSPGGTVQWDAGVPGAELGRLKSESPGPLCGSGEVVRSPKKGGTDSDSEEDGERHTVQTCW